MSSSEHAWIVEVSLPTPFHAIRVNKAFDALEDELGEAGIPAFCQADRPYDRLELVRSYTLQVDPEAWPGDERLMKEFTHLVETLSVIDVAAEIKPKIFTATYGAGEGSA